MPEAFRPLRAEAPGRRGRAGARWASSWARAQAFRRRRSSRPNSAHVNQGAGRVAPGGSDRRARASPRGGPKLASRRVENKASNPWETISNALSVRTARDSSTRTSASPGTGSWCSGGTRIPPRRGGNPAAHRGGVTMISTRRWSASSARGRGTSRTASSWTWKTTGSPSRSHRSRAQQSRSRQIAWTRFSVILPPKRVLSPRGPS